MRIAIDNLDGLGARDYTAALSSAARLTITRTRGSVARCAGLLDQNASSLPVPVRHALVRVTNDAGDELFQGSLARMPERLHAGVGTRGNVHRLAFVALAESSGEHNLAHGTAVTHPFADGDGELHLSTTSEARELATDITVSGAVEPAAYVTEYFLGDGTTDTFDLTQAPFAPAGSADLLDERFDEALLDTRRWNVTDTGAFLKLGAAGLVMSGGNGLDRQTTLASVSQLEIAGTLVLTLDGVMLSGASAGVLCGLYSGSVTRAHCLAGFSVKQLAGNTAVTALVNGVEAGTTFTIASGHRTTLRLRVHCPESIRSNATLTSIADGVLSSFGGNAVSAPVTLLFEARDIGLASNTPATVLYSTTLASSPAACTFAPVNSLQLIGSIAVASIRQAGSAWIVSTLGDGTQNVRLTGDPGDGVDCSLSTAGRMTFFNGRIPVAGEILSVSYRGRRRAVTRLGDSSGSAWQGRVTHPTARTTVDCENAALAALAFARSRSAGSAGSYTIVNPQTDIVPGDILVVAANSADGSSDILHLLVETVTLEDHQAQPELVTCRVTFANNWASAFSFTLAGSLDSDALVPAAPSSAPAATLANASALTVAAHSTTALQVDTGLATPTGGGFEVRRRDWAFGPGNDADLVLRSPVRGFSIPRSAQVERFFLRMYDASNPPVYSRLSSAIFTNLPVG